MRVIITGVTGMVGEGVLLECLNNKEVSEVLILGRRHYDVQHPKVKELLVPDFLKLESSDQLKEYDACFFCAGISSIGMSEQDYTRATYDTTLHVATVLASLNPDMVFNYVSGKLTDSTEKGRLMWARVKGRTENDLMKVPFRGQYNFRPGVMKPYAGQRNVKAVLKIFASIYPVFFPGSTLTLQQVGKAMIKTVTAGYRKQVLEVDDIRELAA